ncbi:DNA repair protein XRCC3 [Polypterus senegalus]|uniref:DNA repair protein XRCC3 n=1 Tax=Polypterus senegalus TaxID=55291 RepID=UPI0019626163|nr:DNA repair protein XRCC3 [Polypterus senegalus]
MDWDNLELKPSVLLAVKKAKIQSSKEILSLSGLELQTLLKLSQADVLHLQKIVAASIRKTPAITALQLLRGECPSFDQTTKLSLGCPILDKFLRGGLPLVGITELAGESSAGKTQICMQLCLSVQYPQKYGGLGAGAVYICTEDAFPAKRLQQLISLQHRLRPEVPVEVMRSIAFGNNIYIEHAGDLESLNMCVSKRIPILMSRGLVRLVVLDSVAALFRCEFEAKDAIVKAKHLKTLGAMLHNLSSSFKTPIVCVNQVTDAVDESRLMEGNFGILEKKVLPALGLTWSSQVLIRLMVSRTHLSVQDRFPQLTNHLWHLGNILRTMEVIFAPHIAQSFCFYTIGMDGVRGIQANNAEQASTQNI